MCRPNRVYKLILLIALCAALTAAAAAVSPAARRVGTTPEPVTSVGQAVEQAMALVAPGMSDAEKALLMHNYVVRNCDYDQRQTVPETSHTAEGVFVEHTALCGGYADAYKRLMDACGIECRIVTSENMNHAWNMIRLGESWYHVDCTMDDPYGYEQLGCGNVTYQYFLRSDREMRESLGHYGQWDATACAEDSGAFIGACFRPVRDITDENGYDGNACANHCVSYANGSWYTLASAGECKALYNEIKTDGAYAVRSGFDGSGRTFYPLGGNYTHLFFHDSSFYAAGSRTIAGRTYGCITRFSADFSETEELYLSSTAILNFNIRQNALWIIESGESVEHVVDPDQSCRLLENETTSALYDPAAESCTLLAYTGREASVTLPASVEGHPITALGACFLKNSPDTRAVVIPQGVRTLAADAFADSKVTSVSIPASCTELDGAFPGATNITRFLVHAENPLYSAVDGNLCNKAGTEVVACAQPTDGVYRIPDGVAYITTGTALRYGTATLIVPESLDSIRETFFPYGLKTIRYAGTEAQWNALFHGQLPSGVTVQYGPGDILSEDGRRLLCCLSGETEYAIPAGVETIGEQTFAEDSRFRRIEIPASLTDPALAQRLRVCRTVEWYAVDEGNPVYTSLDGAIYSKDLSRLVLYPYGGERERYVLPAEVRAIGEDALFYSPSGETRPARQSVCALRELTIPAGVTGIHAAAAISTLDRIAFCGTQDAWQALVTSAEHEQLAASGVAVTFNVSTPEETRIAGVRFVYSADQKSVSVSLDTKRRRGFAVLYDVDGRFRSADALCRNDAQTIPLPTGAAARFFITDLRYLPLGSG